jgi:multidrug transporter EmrE-like cation transporter
MLYKILLGLGVLSNVAAQLFLKSTMRGYDIFGRKGGVLRGVIGIIGRPFFWLSLALYGAGFLFYTVALSKLELSKAYPVSSAVAIVLIVLTSFLFFKESLDPLKVIGLALLISGIFLVLR